MKPVRVPYASARLTRRALLAGAAALVPALAAHAGDGPPPLPGCRPSAAIFASSTNFPLLQYPEGIVGFDGVLYTATYNVAAPQSSRILAFDMDSGRLLHTLGGGPGQELIRQGALLGLAIDFRTGDLYCAANFAGQILRIQRPNSATPKVTLYAQFPAGGGPEDLVFHPNGTLFASDSDAGLVYSIPPGGGKVNLIIGPAGSSASVSDNGLLQAPVAGLSPNGVAFSGDARTFFVANTYTDSVIAFPVSASGKVGGPPRVLAHYPNNDLPEFPFGFEALIQPDTRIGLTAGTPLNGPDGLKVDENGLLWAASFFGDNLTALDPDTGRVVKTLGSSAVTMGGTLNNPSGIVFAGSSVFCSNLGIFTDGSNTNPVLPWRIARFDNL